MRWSSNSYIALTLLFIAIVYWAFGMELFRRAKSSMRGSVAFGARGVVIEILENFAIWFVFFGAVIWLWLSFKWYFALGAFVLMQAIAGLISGAILSLFLARKRADLMFELGGSILVFFGWLVADCVTIAAWLVDWPHL